MKEVLFTYIQFLMANISQYAIWFFCVFVGVPVFWLILKLTDLLYEEKALRLSSFIFFISSVISVALFFTSDFSTEFYKPMLVLLAGIMTFFSVPGIYCENPKVELQARRKVLVLDGYAVDLKSLAQVSVKRCFTKSRRSCQMELFVTKEGSRCRSIYYDTNDVNTFRKVVEFIKKQIAIDYDCSFTQLTIEVPFFSAIASAVMLSLLVFCVLIPVNMSLKEQRANITLPEYKMVIVPKNLYEEELVVTSIDPLSRMFNQKNPQIIVVGGAYSNDFIANYRKMLYSYSNQNFDFNIITMGKRGLQYKAPLEPKVPFVNAPENIHTSFVLSNCKKLCFLDNDLNILYTTEVDTIDPRVNNVQGALNMLHHVHSNNIEQKRIKYEAEERNRRRLEENSDE